MRNIRSVAFGISTAFLASFPAAAFAGDWSLCTQSGWGDTLGYEFILLPDGANATAGGAACEALGADFNAAQAKACEISVERRDNRWAVRKAAGGDLTSLVCG